MSSGAEHLAQVPEDLLRLERESRRSSAYSAVLLLDRLIEARRPVLRAGV